MMKNWYYSLLFSQEIII